MYFKKVFPRILSLLTGSKIDKAFTLESNASLISYSSLSLSIIVKSIFLCYNKKANIKSGGQTK